MKFNINKYLGNYAMHCKTEEEAKIFLRYLDSVGRKWVDGTSYMSMTNWSVHGPDTCYDFYDGTYCNKTYLCFRQGYGSFFRKGGFLFVTLLERLEAFEHNQTEAWYKDIYILNKGKYAKAPVVNVDGEKAVKMYGNVYVTKYDETRKAWLVNTKYGLYRF